MNKKFFMIALAISMIFVLVGCKSATDEDFRTYSVEAAYGIANTNTNTDAAGDDAEGDSNVDDGPAGVSDVDDDTDANTPEYSVRLVPNAKAPLKAFEAGQRAFVNTEKYITAYQNGEWDGAFLAEGGHCLSIDAEGYLWIDCAKAWYTVPDLPDGRWDPNFKPIAHRAEGTYFIWQNKAYDWENVELWNKGNKIAHIEGVFNLNTLRASNSNLEIDGKFYIPRAGFDGERNIVYLISSDKNVTNTKQLDTTLLKKVQHLYYEGAWERTSFEKACYEIVTNGDSYFVVYDVYSHELVVNNVVYNVNLDVPVTCEHVIGDWGIDGTYAILYDMGKVRKVITMPAEIEELVTATDDSIIFVDSASNLWHVSAKETTKVASRVIDTAGVNGFSAYLRADGTAYTYSVWDDAGSTKLASNATDVDYYGDFGFGAVVTEEESNLSYDGAYVFVELPPVPEVPDND